METVEFQKDSKSAAILTTLANIPYGRVSSYGEIAKRSGFPGLARFVARVLQKLPPQSTIPWHRVINSQGKISFPPGSEMYSHQKRKLLEEGIVFSSSDCITKEFFWL
ncbi:MAG: MGMT family protein [Oleiphilus sp.]